MFDDGSAFGLSDSRAEQSRYERLAQAFTIGADFIGYHVALVLSDSIFFGAGLPALLENAVTRANGATFFSYQVEDSERYDVVNPAKTAARLV